MSKVYAAGSGTRWDARRNSSMVHEVPVGEGLRVARFIAAQSEEDWYRWIADGRPVLTAEEYDRVSHRRRRG